jgi:integrase
MPPAPPNAYDLKTLKRMCRHFPIRPLQSKHTKHFNAWEACAGVVTDPETGEHKKMRRAFGFDRYGSPEEALSDAKAWITDMRKVANAEKSAVIALPMALRTSLLYMVELCQKEGFDIVEMCRLGIETAKAKKVAREMLFREAVAHCLLQKEREELSQIYQKELRDFFRDAGNSFDELKLNEITARDLRDWLDEQEVSPVTWNNYRRKFGVLWSFAAEAQNHWVTENVVLQIKPKDVKNEEVSALTPAQAKVILATAHAQIPRLLTYLCVGMFGGLRRSEIEAASWEDIDWETNSIRATGGKMRSVTSRYVHLEPVLIDWLKPIAASGPLCTGTHARRADINRLRELTFDFDGNIFRHSFGTYHYHGFKNAQATIAEMGHTTTAMLFKHYRRPVPKPVAEKFWSLTREVVLSKKED